MAYIPDIQAVDVSREEGRGDMGATSSQEGVGGMGTPVGGGNMGAGGSGFRLFSKAVSGDGAFSSATCAAAANLDQVAMLAVWGCMLCGLVLRCLLCCHVVLQYVVMLLALRCSR